MQRQRDRERGENKRRKIRRQKKNYGADARTILDCSEPI